MKTRITCRASSELDSSEAYIASLKELMIKLLRSAPFELNRKKAETCATLVVKVIHQHQKKRA